MNTYQFQIMWSNETFRKALSKYMVKGYVIPNWGPMIKNIDRIVRKNRLCDDETTLKQIMAELEKFPKLASNVRSSERVATIVELLEKQPVERYLDYGCGDASITQHIGQSLTLSVENIIGVDVYNTPSLNMAITYKLNDQPVAAASIDLVTAFVSFHHIDDIGDAISRIAAMLKPNGVLIIREHNFDNTRAMEAYLNLIHLFIEVKRTGATHTCEILKNINYRSAQAWTDIICADYFELDRVLDPYGANNPQALYYAKYIKK